MPITRRAFGNTVKINANAVPGVLKIGAKQNDLKRKNASPGSLPAKRKNVAFVDKENHVIKVESIQRKVSEIKITEEITEVRAIKSQPAVSIQSTQSTQIVSSVVQISPRVTRRSTSLKRKKEETYRKYTTPDDLPEGVEDYDKTQVDQPDSEAVYANDIFRYLREKEKAMRTLKVQTNQPDGRGRMRAILVDWMVDVQQNFELFHETLYLGVKYVDHYLMRKSIDKDRLQLLGVTAMFVASKFEERCYPAIDDFIYMCADMYTKDDVIHMEMDILSTLTFDMNFPLSYSFLRRYARVAGTDFTTLTLARYILESSMLEFSLIEELDSKISAACLLLAYRMMDNREFEWTETMVYYSGYREMELEPLVRALNKHVVNMAMHNRAGKEGNKRRIFGENIFNKYSDKVFHQVAKIQPLTL